MFTITKQSANLSQPSTRCFRFLASRVPQEPFQSVAQYPLHFVCSSRLVIFSSWIKNPSSFLQSDCFNLLLRFISINHRCTVKFDDLQLGSLKHCTLVGTSYRLSNFKLFQVENKPTPLLPGVESRERASDTTLPPLLVGVNLSKEFA